MQVEGAELANADLPVRLHLTNVAGAGAVQLLQSLLPALESVPGYRITAIHLPDRGALADYRSTQPGTLVQNYRRWLPNVLSRLLECLRPDRRFDGPGPLLVLGDLPLRCAAAQAVFVQTPHLAVTVGRHEPLDGLKFAIARWVFGRNARCASAFIVQTPVMRDALAAAYPGTAGRIHVIAQPVPQWLLGSGLHRAARSRAGGAPLALAYPAAGYPHKNHRLLSGIATTMATRSTGWPVERLTLTLAPSANPAPGVPWIDCVGFLDPQAMLALYRDCDGLLFLSTDESYGFPLVEAMFVGLPIICPDLPYAHTLCGEGAIYFDPRSVESLQAAVLTLHRRLQEGWWPDWSAAMRGIPRDWRAVAQAMLDIVKVM